MKFLNLYNILLQNRLDDYKLQLKDDQLAQSIFSLNDPKKQKMIIKWIKNKSIEYPKDIQIIDKAYQIINRKQLDYNKFNSPQQILNQYQQLSNRLQYNPDNEPCFTNKVQLGNGVVVYNVQDSYQGLKAVRKAVDFNFGKDSNPWCLITRPMENAYSYWNEQYNKIPKRICFQNGKLIAFCANNKDMVCWWDRNDKPHKNIPIEGISDDPKAQMNISWFKMLCRRSLTSKSKKIIKQTYQENKNNSIITNNLIKNPNCPPEILEELYIKTKDPQIVYNPNCPEKFLEQKRNLNKLIDEIQTSQDSKFLTQMFEKYQDNKGVINNLIKNPNTPSNILQKINEKDISINQREYLLQNLNCPIDLLQKYSNNNTYMWCIAKNPNCPIDLLFKMEKLGDSYMSKRIKRNPNYPMQKILKDLNSGNDLVVSDVLENPSCPLSYLEKYADHNKSYIREAIVQNPKCPLQILQKYSDDPEEFVRDKVALNPNCSDQLLYKLSKDEHSSLVRSSAIEPLLNRYYKTKSPKLLNILQNLSNNGKFRVITEMLLNEKTPSQIIRNIYNRYPDTNSVICNVATNINTPKDILQILSKNKTLSIRNSAKQTLKRIRTELY